MQVVILAGGRGTRAYPYTDYLPKPMMPVCGKPILALDEGRLVDPEQRRHARPDLRVSSVPYFDANCGETFEPDGLEPALNRFLERRAQYRPRDYVRQHLSMQKAAENYLDMYTDLV